MGDAMNAFNSCSASDLVLAARQRISELDPAEFATEAVGKSVLIDVREPAEFASGHLPGAINIPRGVLEFQVEAHPALGGVTDPALARRDQSIVLYCLSGGRAALAASALQSMGYLAVRSLRGGLNAWAASGHPIVSR